MVGILSERVFAKNNVTYMYCYGVHSCMLFSNQMVMEQFLFISTDMSRYLSIVLGQFDV